MSPGTQSHVWEPNGLKPNVPGSPNHSLEPNVWEPNDIAPKILPLQQV
jgi:hypothetical protein